MIKSNINIFSCLNVILPGLLVSALPVHAQTDLPPVSVSNEFHYQGALRRPDGSPLVGIVTLYFQIYSLDRKCMLYEEVQSDVDLTPSKGIFNLKVGSSVGSLKRSANDPGLDMTTVFSNRKPIAASPNCLAGYAPKENESRVLRIAIEQGGVRRTITQDHVLSSVPSAIVAESIQGFTVGDLDVRYVPARKIGNLVPEKICRSDGSKIICDQEPSISRGPAGTQGPKGDTGAKGDKGDVGATGATGPVGPAGVPGAKGAQGERGVAGPAGPQGLKGDTGATGAVGPAGAKGAQGERGVAGSAGPQGLKGDTGATGATGAVGPAGAKGAQGERGVAGPAGPQGPKGETGATGAVGPAGAPGAKGAQGERGVAGPAGPQGLKGDSGATGATGAVGPAGAPGAKGAQGERGVAGPVGPQGPKGEVGARGPAGEVGARGPAGATGAQGLKGDKGDRGLTGPQGPSGITALKQNSCVNVQVNNCEYEMCNCPTGYYAAGIQVGIRLYAQYAVNTTSKIRCCLP